MRPEDIALSLEVNREYFNRSSRVLKEEHSGFAPAPGTFTAAAQVAHIAQTIDWFMDGAFSATGFAMDFEAMDKAVRSCTSLEAARKWLNEATDRAKATAMAHTAEEWAAPLPPGPVMGGMPRFVIVSGLTDHAAHHRGALTVYSRLLGLVPPMPYMDM